MDGLEQIQNGCTTIGIELGSTRIKAVLIGCGDCAPLATGVHSWENQCVDGIWTYAIADIWDGLQACFRDLQANVKRQYGVTLETTGAIGISAMMHGYFAFDAQGELLVPFRTWRNTMTAQAADALTEAFQMNIPQRWSIAHLYQAILNEEPHISRIAYLTTLAGYVHWRLTGEFVLGIGDASGMFPIDPCTLGYDAKMLDTFANLTAGTKFSQSLPSCLPRICPVGTCAGTLTAQGARLLDPTGALQPGIPLCPPEGDAQTGMVATNSIAPKTGNVSAGTSIFAMIVLEHPLRALHRQIDLITTPCGSPVAMVHCNNCTSDLDAWVRLFDECLGLFGVKESKARLYDRLYAASLNAAADCGGLVTCGYLSGEHVTEMPSGVPLLLRAPDAEFTIANLMRSLIDSALATLKIGMNILQEQEKITIETLYAHGGLFKSPIAGQRFLASALGVPVALMQSAGEGGAWGIAVLAAYQHRQNRNETLAAFLASHVFTDLVRAPIPPHDADSEGFVKYMKQFESILAVEQTAVHQFSGWRKSP